MCIRFPFRDFVVCPSLSHGGSCHDSGGRSLEPVPHVLRLYARPLENNFHLILRRFRLALPNR